MSPPDSRTVAIINQKGGVGKTTVTLGLASAAAAAQRRVLVVDLDPQASATWVLGIDPASVAVGADDVLEGIPLDRARRTSTWSELVDVVPGSAGLQAAERAKPRRLSKRLGAFLDSPRPEHNGDPGAGSPYDAVLIDCPPSLGGLTVGALVAARRALVVVEPSVLGLRGIGGIADAIDDVWDEHNPDLELSGVILNRVPPSSNEADRRIAELQRIVGSSAVWSPPIPQRVILNEAIGERRPIHSYGWRAADAIGVFDTLWARLAAEIVGSDSP